MLRVLIVNYPFVNLYLQIVIVIKLSFIHNCFVYDTLWYIVYLSFPQEKWIKLLDSNLFDADEKDKLILKMKELKLIENS